MYIELVRSIIENAIRTYATQCGKTEEEVREQIRQHIDHVANEHFKEEPEIAYDDPLCRLGYLYRHASANATIFEKVIHNSPEVLTKISGADKGTLRICAVGGGPGTELLGLAKYLLLNKACSPRKILFTVLDKVSHWGETWQQLAEAVENELRTSLTGEGVVPPTIAPTFLPFDVLDSKSYQSYAFSFTKADVVVFNYLFSENKKRIKEAEAVVKYLAKATPSGCIFVVIDRKENSDRFMNEVVELFESIFGSGIKINTYDGTLDWDERTSDMGKMLTDVLGMPRVKFFTSYNRDPTVFWFAVERP